MRTVVIPLSGGADSTAAALILVGEGFLVRGIFVDYGQPNREAELSCALGLAKGFGGVSLEVVRFPHLDLREGPWRTNEGAFVPFRNSFLLLLAAQIMSRRGYSDIAFGTMSGDTISDSSRDHHGAMLRVLELGLGRAIKLHLPVLNWTKPRILDYLKTRGARTVSCWNAALMPDGEGSRIVECKECAQCRERSSKSGITTTV